MFVAVVPDVASNGQYPINSPPAVGQKAISSPVRQHKTNPFFIMLVKTPQLLKRVIIAISLS